MESFDTSTNPESGYEDLEDFDGRAIKLSLLNEIGNWTLDARSEDNDRYFWHLSEVDRIERGNKYFVIGRKGSGKTAICEHFSRKRVHDQFAERLSFKHFPFNELYAQKDHGFTAPNQFITIWKFVIYSTICRMMIRNEDVPLEVRNDLESLYGENQTLSRRVNRWTAKEFGATFFGIGGKVERAQNAVDREWIHRVHFLEDVISKHAGSAKYLILFDELDEDYREISEHFESSEYIALITSLFKAVHDVRSTFTTLGRRGILPIIFLRDDIYELIRDPDRNKWRDFRLDITWDKDKIKQLIAFRISRAINPTCTTILDFTTAWQAVLGRPLVIKGGAGRPKQMNSFDFIARSTLLRPRDFVYFLKSCAEEALAQHGTLTRTIVGKVNRSFSSYLKDEFKDELFTVLPDISAIFDVFSELHKLNFNAKEFEDAYMAQVQSGDIKEANVTFAMKVLYHFSVLGNNPEPERLVFRYQNRESQLSLRERLVVHRGLFKSLQIR